MRHFDKQRAKIIKKLLEYLSKNKFLIGIFVGGSCTYKSCDIYSDFDFFCVVSNGSIDNLDSKIKDYVEVIPNVVWTVYNQSYPWFGRLTTIFWKNPLMFSIDVGCIEE